MSSVYHGNHLKLTVFGASHDAELGVTVEGLPAGERIDLAALQTFLDRRAPGRDAISSARREPDRFALRSGLTDGVTDGTPLTAVIRNTDIRIADYAERQYLPRPGHADLPAFFKTGAIPPGGGSFSGRMTAPLCIAGGICLQLLERQGVTVLSRIQSIGSVEDEAPLLSSTAEKPFPVVTDAVGERMRQAVLEAKSLGDSLGGVIECRVLGAPVGWGNALFDGLEGRISSVVFAIPAIKAISFGDGFESAKRRGSENNDAFALENGHIVTKTNHCGGILGGVSDGMPIVFRVAVKPTPSIALPQETVELSTMQSAVISVRGRHDACIVPRAVPCVEAAAAIALYDAFLDGIKE